MLKVTVKGLTEYEKRTEAAAIEYHVERFCDLRQLGGITLRKGK